MCVLTTQQNHLTETVLMRGHNICFSFRNKKNHLRFIPLYLDLITSCLVKISSINILNMLTFLLRKCEKHLHCKSFSHFFNKKHQCTVKPVHVATSIKGSPVLSSHIFWVPWPKIQGTLTCIKGSPVLSRQFLSFPWVTP